jgi:serine protease Do
MRTAIICLAGVSFAATLMTQKMTAQEAPPPPIVALQTPAPPMPPGPRARAVVTRIASKRGWLGVGLGELTSERVSALKVPTNKGVEITHIAENSPAAKAGLKEHDVVLEVNGQRVQDDDDFARMISESAPGAKVSLQIWRSGATQTVNATLGSYPVAVWAIPEVMPPMTPFPPDTFESMMGQTPRIGIEGEALDGQLADFFGVKEGVLVRSVKENSPAAKAGLKAGDVIVKVGGTPVASPRELSGVMRAMHKTAAFTVVRNHKEITLNLEIAEERKWSAPGPQVL